MKLVYFSVYSVLSLLAITFGSAIFLWVLYNEFIERLPEYQPLAHEGRFLVGPTILGTGIYWAVKAVQQFCSQEVAEADDLGDQYLAGCTGGNERNPRQSR